MWFSVYPHCRWLTRRLCRPVDLDRFYKQYLAEAESRTMGSTPPQQDSGEAYTRPFVANMKSEKGTQRPAAERPQKRGFERESRVLSPHKRIKQDGADMRECIEIFDSSD